MATTHSRMRLLLWLVVGIGFAFLLVIPSQARAQSGGTAQPTSTNMDAILFVQSLKMRDGHDAIHLVWVPQPIQRICLGKTAEQCANIDYCIRTTNREVKMCQNLGIPLSKLPSYPAGLIPRRQMSVTLFHLTPDYFANLQAFFHSAPKGSLEHLSMSARVKARVQFIRKPDDDDFNVEQILAVAPF